MKIGSKLRLRIDEKRSKDLQNTHGVRKGERTPETSLQLNRNHCKAIFFSEGCGGKTKLLETLAMVSLNPDRNPQRSPAPRLCSRVRCQGRCAHRQPANRPLCGQSSILKDYFIPSPCIYFF